MVGDSWLEVRQGNAINLIIILKAIKEFANSKHRLANEHKTLTDFKCIVQSLVGTDHVIFHLGVQ